MTITDKPRKILWGRSGNRCAICKQELVIDTTCSDDESVVGEECHIISGRPTGPRYDPTFPKEQIDSYENLILLCRVHHKMVDDQHETYTADFLRQTKANHENRVSEKLDDDLTRRSVRLRRIKENIPSCLLRITSGKQLLNLADDSYELSFDHDELDSQEEVELVGRFLQTVRDWGDLGPDLEPSDRVRIGFELTEYIRELEDVDFLVFGAREVQVLEAGVGGRSDWPVAIIHVLRKTNKSR